MCLIFSFRFTHHLGRATISRIRWPPGYSVSANINSQSLHSRRLHTLKDDVLSKASQSYRDHFHKLIEAEREASSKLFLQRASEGLEELVANGYCLTDLSSTYRGGDLLGRHIYDFAHKDRRRRLTKLRYHHFRDGAHVIVSNGNSGPTDQDAYRGTVVKSERQLLRVAFQRYCNDLGTELCRLDVGYPSLIYDQMQEALDLATDNINTEPSPDEIASIKGSSLGSGIISSFLSTRGINVTSRGEDPFISHQSHGPLKNDTRIQCWASRYSLPTPVVKAGDPRLSGLNLNQIRTISSVFRNVVSLIHGPPGTGKSKVIVKAITILKAHFQVKDRILLCCITHAAIANTVDSLASAGLYPVSLSTIHPKSPGYEHTLEGKLKGHPRYPEYRRLQALKRLLRRRHALRGRTTRAKESTSWKAQRLFLSELNDQINILSDQMRKEVLERADVICATCFSASQSLPDFDFPIVIIDEASACTEPVSLIPIMKGCTHLALVGDHKQLGPIIQSSGSKNSIPGLEVSLFERLLTLRSVPLVTLDTQYRMHPGISQFVSTEFYDGLLQDGTVDRHGNPHLRFSAPISSYSERIGGEHLNTLFLDHDSRETKRGGSWYNSSEAVLVLQYVEDLLLRNPDLHGANIGIISPYKAQAHILWSMFSEPRPGVLHSERINELTDIKIQTVDGFQGSEKDIIIFSTVRNHGRISEFIADERRLNVALTRAKRAFVLLGNSDFLSQRYGSRTALLRFIQFLQEKKCILKIDNTSIEKIQLGGFSNVW